MSTLVYSVHIEPMRKGGFYISVPALPECRATASSFDSALSKSKILIEKHMVMLTRRGIPIPIDSQDIRPVCLPIRVNLPKRAKTVLDFEGLDRDWK